MNEIEERFFNAYLKCEEVTADDECCYLKPSVQIGPYVVDFVFDKKYVIEIDGHESHKTKEQRFKDYQRERFLMKEGYLVIRFMGSEVFIDAEKCVLDMLEVSRIIDEQFIKAFHSGVDSERSRNHG
jgi:hypothetical protein